MDLGKVQITRGKFRGEVAAAFEDKSTCC